MSTLSRTEIEDRLAGANDTRLVISPILSRRQIGSVSVDLRLGNQFLIFRMHMGNMANLHSWNKADLHRIQERKVVLYGNSFILHPGQFALAATLEFVKLPGDLEGQVEGRSSWARVGLQIATATCVEPEFSGVVTFELSNVGTMPISLFPGVRIAQMVLRKVEPPVTTGYGKKRKYRQSIGPQFSRVMDDPDGSIFSKAPGF